MSSPPQNRAIKHYLETDCPQGIKDKIKSAQKKDILSTDYPYKTRMKRADYNSQNHILQIELTKLQKWVQTTAQRIAIVFEGRDAAGKGGTIKRVRENLNPRMARIVALSKPTNTEQGQWYFQRYIDHLPTRGTMTLYDRSWYNRGVVENVFDFCTTHERDIFFKQVVPFEKMLVEDGTHLIKFWLNVDRGEQLRRFLMREADPLKNWKLSKIDIDGLYRWDTYTKSISETLENSDHSHAPWTVVRSDDKRRARLEVMRHILTQFDYDGKDVSALGNIDKKICGGIDIWNG